MMAEARRAVDDDMCANPAAGAYCDSCIDIGPTSEFD